MTNEPRAPYDFNRVKRITPQEPDMPWGKGEKAERFVFIAPNPTFKAGDKYSRRYKRPIDIRIYWRGNTVHAFLWAQSRDGEIMTRGHGKAGGGGYCKVSAAVDYAFTSAGIEMLSDFHGYGTRPMQIAIEALAKRLGWNTGEFMEF